MKTDFQRLFVTPDGGGVFDHLNADGTPDPLLRPNQIFATHLLDDSTRAKVVHTVFNNLTYEYGVASLSQDEENFH
ncbi:MAG: amylo-alpha-1,6-glucosidase, partial [Bacteroidota bacterium]